MPGPGKRGAASAKVKTPAKKKTKPRTTLNSGGVGRFLERSRERLRGMFGSKDNVLNEEQQASRTVPGGKDPGQQGQGEAQSSQQPSIQHARTPKSSSTPHETPTLGDRRSPANNMESDVSRLSDVVLTYDAAAAKRIEASDESVDQLILSNPTEDNLQLMLTTLSSRIETFGLDFRQNEGWQNQFELKGKEFHKKQYN